MTGYTKLFGSIVTSTIWREDKETKILWITMLALKNKHGVVEGSVPGLADMARLTIGETEKSLEILSSPDKYSRTQEFEGRRIKAVDGGWLILNHGKWRAKMNEDERREYNRVKQAEHRAKVSKSVSKRKQMSALSAHTDTDTDTDTDTEKKRVGANKSRPAPLSAEELVLKYKSNPAYLSINVQHVYDKMLNHCRLRGKQPTERRFVDWLNREDKPISGNSNTASKPKEGRDPYEPLSDKLWRLKHGQS